jgi:hypothetical protein
MPLGRRRHAGRRHAWRHPAAVPEHGKRHARPDASRARPLPLTPPRPPRRRRPPSPQVEFPTISLTASQGDGEGQNEMNASLDLMRKTLVGFQDQARAGASAADAQAAAAARAHRAGPGLCGSSPRLAPGMPAHHLPSTHPTSRQAASIRVFFPDQMELAVARSGQTADPSAGRKAMDAKFEGAGAGGGRAAAGGWG